MAMSTLLDQIRKAIEAGEKSRYRLSKETGIDQAQLSRFMSGSGAMSYENLELLAKALGLEIIVRPAKPAATKTKER
jgi:transcriptional regulator with XRE-family HTH domain